MGLREFLTGRPAITSTEDELLFEFVGLELERGEINRGLWTKALAETDFDDGKARARYVKLRVESLRKEFQDIAPTLANRASTRQRLANLLEQGCTQEAIDYLGQPITAADYEKKYGKNRGEIQQAVSMRKIKGFVIEGRLWVQDMAFR